MLIRSVRTILLGAVFVVATSLPAAAQTLGVGVSFLEGGIGATVDYSKPVRTLSNDKVLGWVADVSFHRDSEGNEVAEASANLLTFQGGLRIGGIGGAKLRWHAQALVGIARSSYSAGVSDELDELCDAFDVDCDVDFDGSDTSLVFTPGAGIDYLFGGNKALRAQLDLLIGEGGTSARFWVGLSLALGQ